MTYISWSSDFALYLEDWCMNIILRDYESVWPDVWPQNKCRSLWPVFDGTLILPYILKTIWCMNIIHYTWDYESVRPDLWPQNIYRPLKPIFHGPVILPYILNSISWMSVILVIMSHCDVTFNQKKKKCRSQCPIFSWSGNFALYQIVFDGWLSYFWKMSHCNTITDIKRNLGHIDLYFTV